MRLKFLGSGAAFTVGADNYQSNMLLENGAGQSLLIDCGTDIRLALHEAGLCYRDIRHVYISHLHGDHVGGLEWLALSTKFTPNSPKPVLHISQTLVEPLWDHVLSGGLRSLEESEACLSSYFDVECVGADAKFEWEGIEMALVSNLHYQSNFCWMPTYGLFFSARETKIWITADTQFTPDRCKRYYEEADLIFHDCETSAVPTGVHAHYDQLITLPVEIKRKMWLYHYNPGKLPDAAAGGFKGFVRRGQIFGLDKLH